MKNIIDKYGVFDEKVIKFYLEQIIDGIEYLHSNNIVHRDIKCSNILVDKTGTVKISDFGSASKVKTMGESICLKSLKGTLPWMAPEVICQQIYGKKADIWSLGCSVIEMLTGQSPWSNLEHQMQAFQLIGRTDKIPDIPNNISSALEDFLLLCFKRNPEERPSVSELKNHEFFNSN